MTREQTAYVFLCFLFLINSGLKISEGINKHATTTFLSGLIDIAIAGVLAFMARKRKRKE